MGHGECFQLIEAGVGIKDGAAVVVGERYRVQDGLDGIAGGARRLGGCLFKADAAQNVEQGGEGADGAGRGVRVGGDLLDAKVHGATGEDVRGGGVTQAGDEVGVGAEGKLQAEDGDEGGRVIGLGAGLVGGMGLELVAVSIRVGGEGRPMWPMPQASESSGTS